MINIKLNTEKAEDKFDRLPKQILRSVSSESTKIVYEVYDKTYNIAPVYENVLRNTVLHESLPFEQVTDDKVKMTLRYDAWNPKTGFHYASLRHDETTTGIPKWGRIGMEESAPLIEKMMIEAVKRGVRSW